MVSPVPVQKVLVSLSYMLTVIFKMKIACYSQTGNKKNHPPP